MSSAILVPAKSAALLAVGGRLAVAIGILLIPEQLLPSWPLLLGTVMAVSLALSHFEIGFKNTSHRLAWVPIVGLSVGVPPVGIGLLTTFALRWIWKTITA